jgi:hypothetical protein
MTAVEKLYIDATTPVARAVTAPVRATSEPPRSMVGDDLALDLAKRRGKLVTPLTDVPPRRT